MGTALVCRYMNNTILHTDIAMVEKENCSAAPERKSFCGLLPATLFLSGEDFETLASTSVLDCHRKASTAPRFATREKEKAATLYAKRIKLLISAGLIAGTTPTSVRQKLGADCREPASSLLVGDMYELVVEEREQSGEDC